MRAAARLLAGAGESMNRLSTAVLVLFCRRPTLGNGKQRLARTLGAARALAIASALLECALEDAAEWPGELVIAPASPEDVPWAEGLLARPARVEPQCEGNLGQRLNALDAALRARGCQQIIFIGSDAPALKVYDLLAAAQALERADVVLIPAVDGGVTLMGSRVAWPNLADLPWGGSSLGDALQGCCRQHGLSVLRKPPSFDIDEASDLMTARVALVGDKRPARRRLRDLLLTVGETPRRCETGAPSPASEKPRL